MKSEQLQLGSNQERYNKSSEMDIRVQEGTYQSPLPLPSPLTDRGSRLEAWPAAADAKLDGMCEGIIDRWLARDNTTECS